MTKTNQLKKIRTRLGLSLSKLAVLSGVSLSSLRRAEGGNGSLTEVTWNNIIIGLNKGRDHQVFPEPISESDVFSSSIKF